MRPLPATRSRLTTTAEDRLFTHATQYANNLATQAALIGDEQGSNLIYPHHIDRARIVLKEYAQVGNKKQLILSTIAGVLLGTFCQGYTQEFASGRIWPMITYCVMGLLGIYLLFRAVED